MSEDYITELFVFIDDFIKLYTEQKLKLQISQGEKLRKPTRTTEMPISEILTIYLAFYGSCFAHFKAFYGYMQMHHRSAFPKMVTYERFTALIERIFEPMVYLLNCILDNTSDIAYIDSTPIRVCGNKRTSMHKVFEKLAKLGKSSMGWFFGFKLHLVIDLSGNLMAITLTPANQNDRRPVEMLLKNFKGTVCGDKGYISKELAQRLAEKGIKLVTGIKKGMENKLMEIKDKLLLKKRSLIESVIGKLKRCFSLEHSRHRSVKNFCCHIIAALIVYQLAGNKPHTTLQHALPNP